MRGKHVIGIAAVFVAALAVAQRGAPVDAAPHGTLYVGGFPGKIYMIDEATARVSGEIPLRTGIPYRMRISTDRKRFYVMNANMEDMEVVDIASRRSVSTFRLSHDDTKVRILRSFEPEPLDRFVFLMTRSATKLADRFTIGPPALIQYDLAAGKTARTFPWPNGEERESATLRFSADGKLLYFFSEDVLIYDAVELRRVGSWDLQRIEPGLGRVNFGSGRSAFGLDDAYEEPGFHTGLFTISDPVQNRRVMGVARVNLDQKTFEFHALGPASPVGFALAPGRKRAYGLMQQIGHYEFWTFDLESYRVTGRMEFPGRPRMALKTSSNGRVLYVYQAGNTIDLHDAATFRTLGTIQLDGDMTTELFVLPGGAPSGAQSGN